MKFWLFFTRSLVWWGILVRFITRSKWQHVGVGFTKEDGTEWYFEALASYDVAGPRAWGDVARWARKSRFRKYTSIQLPCTPEEAEAAWGECERLQGVSGYNKWQLIRMWLAERFGFRVFKNELKLVCSEFASRVSIVAGHDLRDEKHITHDEVTPGGAYDKAIKIVGQESKN